MEAQQLEVVTWCPAPLAFNGEKSSARSQGLFGK
jgi:hypothetical protein